MKFLYKSVTVKVGALSVLCGLYAFAATEELQNRNEQETVVFFLTAVSFFRGQRVKVRACTRP